MTRNRARFYIVLLILLILVSVIAFVIPVEKSLAFWLSYAFAVIAIAIQAYSYPKAFGGHGARSKLYGFPIARITTVYLIIQLALSLVVILLTGIKQIVIPPWIALIVYAVLLGLTLIGLITAEGVREEVERQETAKPVKTETMRQLQSKAASIAAACQDPKLKKEVEDLAEEFRYSDPVSSEATEKLEMKLDILLDEFKRSGDTVLIKEIRTALAERNQICKQTK